MTDIYRRMMYHNASRNNKIVYNDEKRKAKKYLETMFAEYKCPDDAENIYLQEANSILYGCGCEEVMRKYITNPEQLHDKKYIIKIAQQDPKILDIVGDELKNDGELFLKLYKKKHAVAAYIGLDLRKDAEFLLKLNAISPVCWKYIVQSHYKRATFEQILYVWCYYQLDNFEYAGTKFRPRGSFRAHFGAMIDLCLGSLMKKMNINSKKQDIIDYINKCGCYIVDYDYDFEVKDLEVAKAIIKYNPRLLYDIANREELYNNYDLACFTWEHLKTSSIPSLAICMIKNFPDDLHLAHLVLEKKRWGYAIKDFSEAIRGNKDLVLRLIKKEILNHQALYYLTEDLKNDDDILALIKSDKVLFNSWQRYEKYWRNRAKPSLGACQQC